MKFRSPFLAVAMLYAAVAFAQDKTNDEYPAHTLDEVVALAAQHKTGANVTVEFPIAKVGFVKQGQNDVHVFLDSMENYRDPHSVNVHVFPLAARRLDLTPGANLVGKTMTVHGLAKLVVIKCGGKTPCPQGVKSDEEQSPAALEAVHGMRGQRAGVDYYFQTQIFVREPGDMQIEASTGK